MVLYICEKFHNNSSNGFNLQSGHKCMVEMAMFNVQRAITPKVGKPKLRFMCSACHPYICVKFRENILLSIRLMEGTRMMEALTHGQMDTQNFGGYNITSLPLFVAGHSCLQSTLNSFSSGDQSICNIDPDEMATLQGKEFAPLE